MPRALLIDAAKAELRELSLPEVDTARLEALQWAIGGFLEVAYMWPSLDVLYVDEERQRHAEEGRAYGFLFLPFGIGRTRRFLGNGVVVGREVEGTETWAHLDPTLSLDELRHYIRFVQWGPR